MAPIAVGVLQLFAKVSISPTQAGCPAPEAASRLRPWSWVCWLCVA
jgi:hypothetical protein